MPSPSPGTETGGAADRCELEPIASPGLIQPHQALLCLDAGTLGILARSDNITGFFANGGVAEDLGDIVAPRVWRSAREHLDCDASRGRRLDLVLPSTVSAPFGVAMRLHARGPTAFAEFEALRADDMAPRRPSLDLAAVMTGMTKGDDPASVCQEICALLRSVTGMERVLSYRFDEDGNGEVVAESRHPDVADSFLGFHFPAADIPRQARTLYLRSLSRFTPDRDYVPVPLRPSADPRDGAPFDLGSCDCRSVSAVHREYQRNLDVNGSFSLSLTNGERLLGLVVGHHRQPRRVDIPARLAAETIAAALSLCLFRLEEAAQFMARNRLLETHTRLLEQIAGAENIIAPLFEGAVKLVDVFPAVTGAAVISGRGDSAEVRATGETPSRPILIALSECCRARLVDGAFACDEIASLLPAREGVSEASAGVMAIGVGDDDDMILWFRPEEKSVTIWAGASPAEIEREKRSGIFTPRRSFARWLTERHGQSRPWPSWTLAIARSLRRTINDLILRQSRIIHTLNRRARDLSSANSALARISELLAAEHQRLTNDMALARAMQLDLLPNPRRLSPRLRALGLSLDSVFEPSAAIGGDIWGVLGAGPDRVGLYIADIAGHGVGAALNVFRLQSLISELGLEHLDPAALLSRLNATLYAVLPRGTYATMFACVLDVRANEMIWSAAASPRPLFIRPDDAPLWLDSNGSPLGVRAAPTYRLRRTVFPRGGSLLLYSDALNEATDAAGAPIGEDGILRFMERGHAGRRMADLLPALDGLGALPLADDLTAVLVSRQAAPLPA